MKKLAIGCAVLGLAELGSLPEIERSVHNQRPFEPLAGGEPSAAQLAHLLAIQGAVRTRLGVRVNEIEHRYRRLLAKDSATVVDGPELLSAYRDLAGAYMDGKRAQVDALNRAGFSLDEYRWIRSRAYGALGLSLLDVDVAASLRT